MVTLSKNRQKWLRYVLSGLLLLLLLWQGYRISQEIDAVAFKNGILRPENGLILILVLLLMPLNWLLESWKWSVLLRPFHAWSFRRILRAVLAGVSLSAVTPNRVGEIGGRLLDAKKDEVAGVISSSLLGAICQWIVFILFGGSGLLWILVGQLGWSTGWISLALLLLLVTTGLLYRFGPGLLGRVLHWLARRFSFNLNPTRAALSGISSVMMVRATAIAALRFLVYVTQLYLLLGVFGIKLPLLSGFAGIAAIYLVQAGIPLPPGINLVTRAELGVLLWGNDPATVAGSLAAFSGLFAVNVLLPSLLAYWGLVKKA